VSSNTTFFSTSPVASSGSKTQDIWCLPRQDDFRPVGKIGPGRAEDVDLVGERDLCGHVSDSPVRASAAAERA
jgi:hypothetical protein